MKRRYAQLAQKSMGGTHLGASPIEEPPVGMDSLYIDYDSKELIRINSDGFIHPVAGVHKIGSAWALSTSRVNKPDPGDNAIDFTVLDVSDDGSTGHGSVAIGKAYAKDDGDVAIGSAVSAKVGVAIGYSLSPAVNAVIIGRYNVERVSDLLQIGLGEDGLTKLNIFEINQHGVARSPEAHVDKITEPKDLVTLEKLHHITQVDHTFAVMGAITNISLPGFFIHIPSGSKQYLIGIMYKSRYGTCMISVVQHNGQTVDLPPIPAFTGLQVSPTFSTIMLTPDNYFELTKNSVIEIDIAKATNCTDLTVTLIIEKN